jgi:UDP-GlcNAc:undecaprenyl-phosphate GlcNAc-1-phosphate transferase
MWLALGLAALISFLLTLNLTPRLARLAARKGFVDLPGDRKAHPHPVPYGGGLAVAVGMTVTVLAGVLTMWITTWPELAIHAGGVFARLPQLLTILIGGISFMLVGLVDDKVGLTPRFRLVIETLIAIGVALAIEPLSLFLGEGVAADLAGRALTVLWIVGIANMFNMLDHYDGICAGVALIAGIAFFCIACVTGQLFIAALLAALMGSIGGFLLFNLPPAKVYLGDAGSLFIGYMLATLCVLFTFYDARYALYSYFVPFAVLAIPLFDTSVVCLARLRAGQSLFKGDRRHLAHRLSELGLPPRRVVLVVYGLTLLSGIGANLLYEVERGAAALAVLVQIGVVFIIVTVLEGSRKRNE